MATDRSTRHPGPPPSRGSSASGARDVSRRPSQEPSLPFGRRRRRRRLQGLHCQYCEKEIFRASVSNLIFLSRWAYLETYPLVSTLAGELPAVAGVPLARGAGGVPGAIVALPPALPPGPHRIRRRLHRIPHRIPRQDRRLARRPRPFWHALPVPLVPVIRSALLGAVHAPGAGRVAAAHVETPASPPIGDHVVRGDHLGRRWRWRWRWWGDHHRRWRRLRGWVHQNNHRRMLRLRGCGRVAPRGQHSDVRAVPEHLREHAAGEEEEREVRSEKEKDNERGEGDLPAVPGPVLGVGAVSQMWGPPARVWKRVVPVTVH